MLSRSNIRQYVHVKYIKLLFEVQTHLFFLQVLQDLTPRTHCMFLNHLNLSTCDMKHFIGVYVHIFKV